MRPLRRFPGLHWTNEERASFQLRGKFFTLDLKTEQISLINEITEPAENVDFNEKSGRRITPRNLELSRAGIEILEAASAQKLGLDPLAYL